MVSMWGIGGELGCGIQRPYGEQSKSETLAPGPATCKVRPMVFVKRALSVRFLNPIVTKPWQIALDKTNKDPTGQSNELK